MATRNSASRINFTKGRVDAFACPASKARQYLWDSGQPGLGLLATPPKGESEGAVSYVFQRKLGGHTVRVTIGDRATWTLEEAREEAKRMGVLVDSGIDPRLERKERLAQAEAARLAAIRSTVTLGEAWDAYVSDRAEGWSESHRHDHYQVMTKPGQPYKRQRKAGPGIRAEAPRKTRAGALYSLRAERLEALTAERLSDWLKTETKMRPTVAARAFRLLRSFLNWAAERPEYRGLLDPAAVLTKEVRRKVPCQKPKDDCLQREQLALWFEAVLKISNPVVSAYLQGLLLTGARSGELSHLRWDDVDFQWRSLTIRDKVEGKRTIPLTPYLATLLRALPRRTLDSGEPNPWVFSSPITSHGRIGEANHIHTRVVKTAGLPPLTLHGLRRSFGTLSEWVECPVGVVAQIEGRKPSAIVEKHYRRRPLDLLRQWHEKIEGWILSEAGIQQPEAGAPALKVVR